MRSAFTLERGQSIPVDAIGSAVLGLAVVFEPADRRRAGLAQGSADRFDPPEHAQHVLRRHLLKVALGEAAAHQLREQVRKSF